MWREIQSLQLEKHLCLSASLTSPLPSPRLPHLLKPDWTDGSQRVELCEKEHTNRRQVYDNRTLVFKIFSSIKKKKKKTTVNNMKRKTEKKFVKCLNI